MKELYSLCQMCNTIYEIKDQETGEPLSYDHIKNYNQDSEISHGVCPQLDCRSAYLIFALGCTKKEAENMLEEIVRGSNE